jgi:phosphoglycerate dehydrogenase-like enzyme
VGTDEMDHAEATAQGVAICNAAGALSTTVAECAMGLMINVLRDFVNADADVRCGDWSRFFESKSSSQLEGKMVGLVGFGDIARALAKMLRGFDCKVIACDINFRKDLADELGVTETDLETIRCEADVISLHVPVVKETQYMINKEFLSGMKKTAIIINTGRGKLVNEKDLVEALDTGVIAGAGLDVFEQEPLTINSPLIKLKNVMLLPHYASGTFEALARVNAISSKNAVDFLQGKKVETILNPNYIENVKSGGSNK